MRISVAWLSDWVDAGMDPATLATRLTMAGLEVEAVEPAAGDFQGVVVGKVLSVDFEKRRLELRGLLTRAAVGPRGLMVWGRLSSGAGH